LYFVNFASFWKKEGFSIVRLDNTAESEVVNFQVRRRFKVIDGIDFRISSWRVVNRIFLIRSSQLTDIDAPDTVIAGYPACRISG
jgi:hypothetical protein